MRQIRSGAEDSLSRDDTLQVEEDLAELVSSCLEGRSSIVAPSGLEMDFGDVPFPELGGGPGTFWAGSFTADGPVQPSTSVVDTGGGLAGYSSNS